MTNVINIESVEQFENELEESGRVLVDFWASWCGPCRMLAPVLDDLSEDYKILKVEVEDNPEIANEFDIMSVPTLVLFKDGKPVDNMTGFAPKEKIEEFMNK